jgi:hypothetical protein
MALAEVARPVLVTAVQDAHRAFRALERTSRSGHSRLISVSMSVIRRTLVLVTIVTAAAALGWASSQGAEPAEARSDHASLSAQHGQVTTDPAVVERTAASFARALTGDKPSSPQVPWELLATCGLAGIAAAAFWSRFRRAGHWSRTPLLVLRCTVALRAPPSSRLL